MNAQKALEEFLGDKVERLALGLFLWRGKYYEVLPSRLTTVRHNWSGFVRLQHGKKVWMMREASEEIIHKYYPNVSQQRNFAKALELNRDLIKKL